MMVQRPAGLKLLVVSLASVPIAATILVLAHALQLGLPTLLTLCGVAVALVGGATKIGSP